MDKREGAVAKMLIFVTAPFGCPHKLFIRWCRREVRKKLQLCHFYTSEPSRPVYKTRPSNSFIRDHKSIILQQILC